MRFIRKKQIISYMVLAFFVFTSVFGCSSSEDTRPVIIEQNQQTEVKNQVSDPEEQEDRVDNQSADSGGREISPSSPPATTNVLNVGTKKGTGILKVHFLDVGQADSILVQTPSGLNMLIDAGNNDDDTTVVNYIKAQGISKLDVLIGTHPHEDHIGGLDSVIKTFNIGQVVMPRVTHTSQTYKDVLTAILDKGLKVTEAKAGLNLDLGADIKVQVVAPNRSGYDELNNYSAVVKLIYADISFLFAGDAGELSENEMLTSGYDLKADVLKVGHHGSDTSSSRSFLSRVQPKIGIISVGNNNSYGHPAQTALDNLTAVGSKIYRTDQAGTIVVESDGENIALNAVPSEIKPRAPDQESIHDVPEEKPATVVPVAPTSPAQGVTVFITKTGEKYHRDGCRYLSKSKIPIVLSAAKSKGYTPCSVCDPPK